MPDLTFRMERAEAVPYAASPLLNFKIRISNRIAEERVQTVALRCQIMIEPTRRGYSAHDQKQLADLFGEPERWGQTLRSFLWTHTSLIVPPFVGTTVVDLPVPCTFDFNLATTKYFAGLDDGEIPLILLFSGSIFYEAEDGALQVAQIPWDKEVRYRLPLSDWKKMMDFYYPNTAWLCLRKDIFDRLNEYKTSRGLPMWEQALESIMSGVEEGALP